MRRPEPTSEVAAFAREWNAAFALVVLIAALLFASGHYAAGAVALGLAAIAFLARRRAMRRLGRGFYGQ
jgi:hypothetical protein